MKNKIICSDRLCSFLARVLRWSVTESKEEIIKSLTEELREESKETKEAFQKFLLLYLTD